MTATLDDLATDDLAKLLRSLPPAASEGVARLIVALRSRSRLTAGELHLDRSLSIRGLTGHHLVADIIEDLRGLARHEPTPAPDYRDMLRTLAYRHGVEDDGTRPAPSVERDIMRRYGDKLRPDPASFDDLGHTPIWQKIGFAVPGGGWIAWMLSPNWPVVTAATLEIAAQRRIAITRHLRQSLEA